jgi:phosphoribosylaminoimidazolecarboxamide formyltransferase/IMP cyclohydrolase
MKKAALISVSDKTGLFEFAKELVALGYELLGTRGTKAFLEGEGLSVVSIEEYTGQKEILDGRVKTLHPRIHAGLLADRSKPEHVAQLEEDGLYSIDVAVINLYPFIQNLASEKASDPLAMVELVDIGGPTMIRAAAKNFKSVVPAIDPQDYEAVLGMLKEETSSAPQLEQRRALAVKVFTELAQYNLEIATYFSEVSLEEGAENVPENPASPDRLQSFVSGAVLERSQELRYGENPHQKAGFYSYVGRETVPWKQYQGKDLSYNNLLDFDAAARIVQSLPEHLPAVAIIKHLNPCGAAIASTLEEALAKAKAGDPRSHFGGIIACNKSVSEADALLMIEDFTEIIVAPGYDEGALVVFSKRKNLRVIELDFTSEKEPEIRSVAGGVLIQEGDTEVSSVNALDVATAKRPSEQELSDLQLAWALVAHVKSNAITIVKDGMLLAAGAGQMSRIDSAEVALQKIEVHEHDCKGAVCASDAFFPFSDCIEKLAEAGVTAVVAPGGARRDDEVAAVADDKGVALLFAPDRHFRH